MASLVCYPFIGDSIGGAHLSAIELIKGIDRKFFEPLIVLHEEGPLSIFLQEQGMKYLLLPLKGYAGSKPNILSILKFSLKNTPTLIKFMHRHKIQITHCNDLRTNMTWLFACRLSRIPFVWHQRTKPNSNSLLWTLVPKLSSHCVTISHTTLKNFGTIGPRLSLVENPISIDNAVRRNFAREALIAAVEANSDDVLIGFVGRLVTDKNPELCIDILACLSKLGHKNVRLLFYGVGKKKFVDNLKFHAQKSGLSNSVHFMGFRENISFEIAGIDILIAPSAKEGFGRTVVEAMFLGTPVIASDISAHSETIEHEKNGFLAKLNDANSFSKVAQKLISDDTLASTISKEAKRTVLRRFSPKDHVTQIQAIYNSVLI